LLWDVLPVAACFPTILLAFDADPAMESGVSSILPPSLYIVHLVGRGSHDSELPIGVAMVNPARFPFTFGVRFSVD
jgi:hypothetical protein